MILRLANFSTERGVGGGVTLWMVWFGSRIFIVAFSSSAQEGHLRFTRERAPLIAKSSYAAETDSADRANDEIIWTRDVN